MARIEPSDEPSLSENGATSPAQIPGVGPIRARALAKAGWDSIASLKKATLDDLLAVRGISPNKAQQILEYVQRESHAVVSTTGAALETVPAELQPQETPSTPASVEAGVPDETVAPGIAPAAEPPLQRAAWDVVAAATVLLQTEQARGFSARLKRQVEKAAACSERLGAQRAGEPKGSKKRVGRLRKIERLLSKAADRSRLGAKRQDRLADALRDCRRKLKDT